MTTKQPLYTLSYETIRAMKLKLLSDTDKRRTVTEKEIELHRNLACAEYRAKTGWTPGNGMEHNINETNY